MEIIDSYQVPKGFGEPTGTDNNSIVIDWFIFHLAFLPLIFSFFILFLLCFLLINIRLIFMHSCVCIPATHSLHDIGKFLHPCVLPSISFAAIQDKQRRELRSNRYFSNNALLLWTL